jgi:hypothetical protein
MTLELQNTRELDHRISDGIHVRMLWLQDDARVMVSVLDTRTGTSFAVDVGPDESPRDVFHHPFAYAAYHGIDTSAPHRSEELEVPLAA